MDIMQRLDELYVSWLKQKPNYLVYHNYKCAYLTQNKKGYTKRSEEAGRFSYKQAVLIFNYIEARCEGCVRLIKIKIKIN